MTGNDTQLDIIETIDKLFEDIYKDHLTILKSDSFIDNNEVFYTNLMKRRLAILCIIALNPINTYDTLYALTPKDYLLK
jgi:hypothetical protein